MRGFTYVGLGLMGAVMVNAITTVTPTVEDDATATKPNVHTTPTEAGAVHPVAVLMDNGDVVPIPTIGPDMMDPNMYGPMGMEYGYEGPDMQYGPYGDQEPFPVAGYGPDGYPYTFDTPTDDGAEARKMTQRRGYGQYGGYTVGGYGKRAYVNRGYGNVRGYGKWGGYGKNGGYGWGGYGVRDGIINWPIVNKPVINTPIINKPVLNRPIIDKPSFPEFPVQLPTRPVIPTFPEIPVQLPTRPVFPDFPTQLPTRPTLPDFPTQLPTYDVQPAYTFPEYNPMYNEPACPPGVESCGGSVQGMYVPRREIVTNGPGKPSLQRKMGH